MAKEHLIPIQPGEIRNPYGRAGKDGLGGKTAKSIKSLLERKLHEIDEETGKTAAEMIIEQVIRQAKRGDLKAIDVLFDRTMGKPKQEIDNNINSSALGVIVIPKKTDYVEGEIAEINE